MLGLPPALHRHGHRHRLTQGALGTVEAFYVVLAVLNYVDKIVLKLTETLLLLPSECWTKGVHHYTWLLRVFLECH